jgi:hypothetical protein
MAAKQYQTAIPSELRDAVTSHARAVIEGDDAGAEDWVEGPALESYRGAVTQGMEIRPLTSFDIIAHARLGFQFIVKVRFHGANNLNMPLQVRWRRQNGTAWRIVEAENLNAHSPWRRPDKPKAVNVDA